MSRDRAARRRLLRGLLVVALVTTPLAGCAGLAEEADTRPPLPDRETAAERRGSLVGLSATVTTVAETNGTTRRTVSAVDRRFDPTGYRERVVFVEADGPDAVTYVPEGRRLVVNESVTARYDPTADRLTYTGAPPTVSRTSYLDIVAAARANGTVDHTAVPGLVLPRVPTGLSPGPTASASFYGSAVAVTYTGTEPVDGRESYRLVLDPRDGDVRLRSLIVWLDTETLFPLKQRFESVVRGGRETFTRTYGNVTVDPAFDPETFRLDPAALPGDPDVSGLRYHDTYDALLADVPIRLLGRTLADDYRFDRGFHVTGDPSIVVGHYAAADAPPVRLTVVTADARMPDGERVSIGPATGQFRTRRDVAVLTWTTDERTHTLSGRMGRETLLRIARAVDDRVTG